MSWIAVGVTAVGSAIKIGTGLHQNKLAKQIHPQFSEYTTSPYASEQLGVAKNLFNAPMPGQQEQLMGIQAAQSNSNNFIQRNATDSAQALALGALNNGQANDAYSRFAQDSRGYKMGLLNNLNSAYGVMINEGDKKFNSMFQKYQMDTAAQQGLRTAGMQNSTGGINDIASGISTGQQANDQQNFYNQLLALYKK